MASDQNQCANAGNDRAPVIPTASNIDSSLRAEGEAIQGPQAASGLLRSARNDASKATGVAHSSDELWAQLEALSPEGLRKNMEYAERVLKRLAKCKKAK